MIYFVMKIKQVKNLNSRIQDYKPLYAKSRSEADEKLNAVILRNGVRIKLHEALVEYKTESKSSNGLIEDISISGCAFYHYYGDMKLNVNDEVEVLLISGLSTRQKK